MLGFCYSQSDHSLQNNAKYGQWQPDLINQVTVYILWCVKKYRLMLYITLLYFVIVVHDITKLTAYVNEMQ